MKMLIELIGLLLPKTELVIFPVYFRVDMQYIALILIDFYVTFSEIMI
jgi:hypothetical protein